MAAAMFAVPKGLATVPRERHHLVGGFVGARGVRVRVSHLRRRGDIEERVCE